MYLHDYIVPVIVLAFEDIRLLTNADLAPTSADNAALTECVQCQYVVSQVVESVSIIFDV